MATTMSKFYTAVVGVDFGTGGYAIGVGYKNSSYIMRHETIEHGTVQKNSAALLCRTEFNTRRYAEGDIEFYKLGYSALTEFSSMASEERQQYVLFPSAKMALYENERSGERGGEALATAVNGATAPAADIIRMALAEVYKQVIVKVAHTSSDQMLWVITVPTIWSDAAKQLMRESAIKAGIPDRNLIFALEPETASISCQMSPGCEFEVEPFEATSSYMVVDAGKGTVDITVHQVREGRLADVTVPRGDACGSGCVDDMFVQLLNDCFTPEAIDEVKMAMPNMWLDIMLKFERVKCRSDIDTCNKMQSLELGTKFLFFVRDGIEEDKGKLPAGVTIEDRYAALDMTRDIMYSLFLPSLNRIYQLVSESLADPNVANTCGNLFLVGGYASCPYLHSTVLRAISDARLKCLTPVVDLVAVVRGAVMYGLNPDVLSARMSNRTIAVSVSVPFDPVAHADRQSIEIEGEVFCTDALDILVKKGQQIKSNQLIEHVYSPLVSDRQLQNVSVVRIYHSPKDDVKYVGEEGVRQAGELVVKLPPDADSDQVRVSLSFGSTEVKASASMVNGKPIECALDFYCHGFSRRTQAVISVDVCFVMDCTGSMAAYIDAAKDQLVQIGNNVIRQLSSKAELCFLRFAFVGYRDFSDPVPDRLTWIDFTNDFNEVRKFIAGQEANGGGDGPEDLLGGLHHAASLNWSAKNRFIVLSADAPCHGSEYSGSNSGDSYPEGNPDGLTADDVLDKITGLKAQLLFTRITDFTQIMIEKFKEKHPITEMNLSSTNCINQFGRSLTSEIVGYIKRHGKYEH